MQIGQLILAWRKENNISVRKAEKIIGLSYSTLNRIENGGAVDGKTMLVLIKWLFENE